VKIIWAADTLSVPIFLLASPQKGFPLQSLPQYKLRLKIYYRLFFYSFLLANFIFAYAPSLHDFHLHILG